MSTNPYATPTHSPSTTPTRQDHGESELASKWIRFVSAMLDGVIILWIINMVLYLTGDWLRALAEQVGVAERLVKPFVGVLVTLSLNGYLLASRGQTIGKVLTKIQIVDFETDLLMPFVRVYVLRYLWMLPVTITVVLIPGSYDDPVLGLLGWVDALLIFTVARRCLHDYIAGSKVVLFQPDRARIE